MNLIDLQARMDTLAYPPSCVYRIDGLVPAEPLATREANLIKVCPKFYGGHFLLDVGCNKGYHSLKAAQAGMGVDALDTDIRCIELCRDIATALDLPNGRARFFHTGFRDWRPVQRYDRVFLGHCYHHVFMECGGWEWIDKLSCVCQDGALVVIEGPRGYATSPDLHPFMQRWEREFTAERFNAEMMRHGFNRIATGPSSYYTIERDIMVFRYHGISTVPLSDLKIGGMIRDAARPGGQAIHRAFDGGIHVALKLRDGPIPVAEQIEIEISALAGYSNGMSAWVTGPGGRAIGWLEEFDEREPNVHFAHQKEIFHALCRRNVRLTRQGYYEADPCTTNWWASPNSEPMMFDKDSVRHISTFTPDHVATLMKNWALSYNTIAGAGLKTLRETMESRSSVNLEALMQQWLETPPWA